MSEIIEITLVSVLAMTTLAEFALVLVLMSAVRAQDTLVTMLLQMYKKGDHASCKAITSAIEALEKADRKKRIQIAETAIKQRRTTKKSLYN